MLTCGPHMKRSAFPRRTDMAKPTGRQWEGDNPPSQSPRLELRITETRARLTISLPKKPVKRSEAYLRYTASRPCAHCGIQGYSNACHGDEGKGIAIKSGDDTVWPGCVDRPGKCGCHWLIGTSGMLKREHKRKLEARYAQENRMAAQACGQWPETWKA